MSGQNFSESHVKQSFNYSSIPMRSSFVSRSSTFVNDSTGYINMRESAIANLPNYKKKDLSQNSMFIVVFQAIQIERLTTDVEVLRMKEKQFEREKFNFQNYDVQIRELTDKCFAYERERQQYRDELDKLNKICETLYHESDMLRKQLHEADFTLKQKYESERQKSSQLMGDIQKWKARYQAAEKSKMKQLEDLRNLMECQRKSMIDREIREMTIRYQTERSGLENEIRKCREMLQNRNREIEDYKQKCQKYEIGLMQLRNYENVIADNENKIVLVNQELLRLNEVLRGKEDQIHSGRNRENRMQEQIREQQEWEYNSKQLKSTLENRQKDIQEWKVRVSRLEVEASRGHQLQHYNDQLNNKLSLSAKEIQRIGVLLQSKMNEVENWKRQYTQMEMEASKFENAQHNAASLQSKLRMLQSEMDRINGIAKSRLAEIDQWKTKYYQLEKHMNSFANTDKQMKNLQEKYGKQIKLNEQMQFSLAKQQKNLNSYRNYESMFKDHERKNAMLNKEVQRLNNLVRGQTQQLGDYRTKYSRVENSLKQFKDIEHHLRDYENKIGLQTQELQRLNTLLRSKGDDIDSLERDKLQMHQKMAHYRNYEVKASQNEQIVSKLESQLTRTSNEIENWQNKAKQSELKSRELDNHLFSSTQEKEKLSTMIRNKNSEYEALRSRYSNLQDDLRKVSQLQMVCQDQHNQILTYISDIEGLQRSSKNYQEDLDKERNVNNQFACKIIILSAEIERMAKSDGFGGKKAKEFVELQENFSRVQTKVQTKNSEIDILMNKINYLQSQIANLSQEFNRLLNEVHKGEQENIFLIKKIDEYQDYAKKIHILGAEIDRLSKENKALDEDARRIRLKFADNIANETREQASNLMKVLVAAELQSLRARVSEREVSVEQMRKSILEPVRKV